MHSPLPQPHLTSAALPPAIVSSEPHLPWRAMPRAHDAQSHGTASRPAMQWIWHSRFGTIVIEVRGNDVFVNGDRVAPHAP